MLKLIKEKFLNRQFITFGIIGFINTALAQIFYVFFVSFVGLPGYLSSGLSDTLPMAVSYVLNAKFTYHEKLNWKSALTFPLAYLPGIIVNMIIVSIVINVFHAPKALAKLISLPITIPLNFLCVSFIMKKTGNKGE
ncbi:MAG: GtrA family protein [Anaerorhabdus sp.]